MGQLGQAEVAGLTIESGLDGKVREWEEVAAAVGGWQWHVTM
jgi:hypothetical protein